jgi:hypothetical protein
MDEKALKVARLYAAYRLGDPDWADMFADVFADPDSAAEYLREELGDEYDTNFRLANANA